MKRILLINDSKFESIILKDNLSTLGYEVIISDEYSALLHVKKHQPDFLMVNYIMKETTGDELIQTIKSTHPGIKCVLTSSNSMNPSDFANKGIDALIKTPIEKQSLAKILNDISNNSEKSSGREQKKDTQKASQPKLKSLTCPKCQMNIEPKSERIFQFCPYCGGKL